MDTISGMTPLPSSLAENPSENSFEISSSGETISHEQLAALMKKLADNIETVIVGKRELIEACLIGLMAGGHILLEDVPGVGKTMLARSLARTLGTDFKRIQFTPDLLPSDVTGTVVFDPNERAFHFREGPVFSHVVLADEINRASPKTQSALLECMEEGQVTVDLETRKLPEPFFVIATQNPAESEGVYPLPESQLDRFAMRLSVGYPHPDAEKLLMKEQRLQHPIETLESVTDVHQIRAMQAATRLVAVHDEIYDYVLRLANATRNHPRLMLGLSPRGSIALARCAQAHAALRGRDYVIPDDVKAVAVPVMAHRLIPVPEARIGGEGAPQIARELLKSVAIDGKK
ncbi:MoxR-like ATPase [Abditibacterium utsteinense]|uniref:MoxR-like ATPase n=1 Tax=Abditibacterium utsteinense TaxID=1960156 RepID=A0A2S8SXD6_9BACT|nr:MoxR family ATPase [Abditibacterium utsteinense]PQV65454.1 MoxR-like ATPase [Abditibacterium utsteinense]